MSYNTRRGNAGNFNKGVTSSQVGQRRPVGSSNYGQNLPSQNPGSQQQQNYGYFTQQPGTRQQPPRQPSAQQQMAKQQQMLVQKKQQLAQQQKQQQQKQQMVQQKQQANQKQQEEELKKKKELEQQKLKEVEAQKQKELELQKQKELELQKQKELELQKQKELDLQKQKELELEKQKAIELQKQKELELQKQKELELQQQKELELQKQKDLELQKQKSLELQRQKEIELQKQKELELQQKQESEQQKLTQQQSAPETMEVDSKQETPDLVEAPLPPSISGEGAVNTESKPYRRRFPHRNRKLSKYEIQRRRNLRLSKLLQPKSAMVILNEVGKNVTYNVDRSQSSRVPKGFMFKAIVTVDGTAHEGFGLSKSSAKNEAAEKALKFLIKHKKLVQTSAEPTNPPQGAEGGAEGGQEPMDTVEKEEKIIDIPLAWQQFASFAIYKLLDSWGEDLEIIKEDVKVDKKPAKNLPPNAELMNPLMLMNQMLPRVNFEELPRTSNAHFLSFFNFRAVVDGKTFTGNGSSKKVAKKAVAFAICKEVLGIQYPPEIYTPPSQVTETI